MRKQKGFTLVEIIISVTLLAIIGITIGISFNKIFKSQTDDNQNNVISRIKSAADVYMSGNTTLLNQLYTEKAYLYITIGELRKAGLLDENLKNGNTNEVLSDDTQIKISLDDTGLIKYTYPISNETSDKYLQALNVFLEKNEIVDCTIGKGTHNLVLVNSDGTYDTSGTEESITINSCDWNQSNASKPGTYKVNYTYQSTDGISKKITRTFIVQDEVVVTITSTGSSGWNKNNFNLIAKTDHNVKITYSWKKNQTNLNNFNSNLTVNETGIDTYSVDYVVYNYNDQTKMAYTGSSSINVKVEFSGSMGDFTITGENNNWVKEKLHIIITTSSTPFSGIDKYQYCISNLNESCSNWSELIGNEISPSIEGSKIIFIRLITQAGNIKVKQTNYNYDKTLPSCTSSGGSSNWTKNNITIKGTCNDSLSGCTGNASKTYSSNINSTVESPGIVYDNAGNSTTCPTNQTVRIDKTVPSCTSSGGSTSWTKNNVTINGTCNDSLSGCAGNVSKTYSNNINSNVESPGTVYDNAGNSVTCPGNQTIRIDKVPPFYTGGSMSSTNIIAYFSDSASSISNIYYYVGTSSDPSTNYFTTNSTVEISQCGYTFYGYAYAVDAAGNQSNPVYVGQIYTPCYYPPPYEPPYEPPYVPPPNQPPNNCYACCVTNCTANYPGQTGCVDACWIGCC